MTGCTLAVSTALVEILLIAFVLAELSAFVPSVFVFPAFVKLAVELANRLFLS